MTGSVHDPAWLDYVAARRAAIAAFDRGDWVAAEPWVTEADARERRSRGYDGPSAIPSFPVRMVVDDLLIDGISDRRRVERVVGLTGLGFAQPHTDLLAATIADPLRWPLLDEWRDWFSTTTWAPGWPDEVIASPEPEPTAHDEAYRTRWATLPEAQALALAEDRDLVEVERLCVRLGLTYDDGLGVVRGLVGAGLAEHPVAVRTRLAKALTIPELKALASAHGLTVSGRKDAILDRLMTGVPSDRLEAVPTPDYVGFTRPDSPWLAWRRGFVTVWTATLVSTFYSASNFKQYRDAGCGVEIDGHGCPACVPHEGRIAPRDLAIERFPPFHPGCTCSPDPVPADEW